MRAIWKGAVSFGLVNVPVRLFSATENHDLRLHQVRRSDGSRIRYRRVAQADGEEVAYDDIVKGYETEDGSTIVLTDEDLATLPNRSSREISVEKFVPADQIDPIAYDKTYYLEPDKSGAKAYGLLREALTESDLMAVATVAVRTRMTMAVLRVRDEVIVLQTMLWPDEIRDADQLNNLDGAAEPKESELKMARMLVESMSGDYHPEEYEDDYAAAVESLVQSKIEGGEVTEAAEAEEEDTGQVVDLLAALQRSVDRAKTSRGEPIDEEDEADEEAEPAEQSGTKTASSSSAGGSRRAAKKTSAKKSSATESSAEESPAQKPATKSTTKKATTKKATTKKSGTKKSAEKTRKKAAS